MKANPQPTIGLICPPSLSVRAELYMPNNLTILSAAAKQAGFGVEIIDLNLLAAQREKTFFDDPLDNTLKVIEESADRVDVYGITTLCATYPFVLRLAETLKERYRKPVVFGGPQASMTAQRTMEIYPQVDFIVAHEGEVTLVELLKALFEGRDLAQVAGIYYREDGKVRATPFRPFITDLDDSPFPDFAAIDIRSYREIYSKVRIPVDIGRGCPFRCTFCSTAMMWKRSFRMKSPQRAVAEMDALHQQFGIDWFFLTQDNLTTKKSYVHDLCEALKGRRYQWDCYSRCDTLDEEMLSEMVSAGCRHVFFGIESASEEYQKIIRKNLKLASVEKAIDACVRQRISFTTSYIIGFPEEDRQAVSATLQSCFRDAARNPRQVKLNVLAPIPGTELSEKYADRFTSPLAIQPDASPFLLKNELADEAKRAIAAHPDLFSSFYFIRPTHFSLQELFDIRCFYGLLIDAFPRTTHLILRYSSLKPFDLIDIYRARGLPLDPREMTPPVMQGYFAEVMERGCGVCQDKVLPIEELLRYELAVYTLRNAPTPEGLRDSQARAADLPAADGIERGRLTLSPSLAARSFRVDIHGLLQALNRQEHRCSALEVPRELIFYEDALLGDIVAEEMAPEARTSLERLQTSGFTNGVLPARLVLDFVKKGIVIWHPLGVEGKTGTVQRMSC